MAHRRIGRAIRRLLVAVILVMPWTAVAQQAAAPPPAEEDAQTLALAKKTQNPSADLISLPLQSNLNFGYGANDAPHSSSTADWTLRLQVQFLFPR